MPSYKVLGGSLLSLAQSYPRYNDVEPPVYEFDYNFSEEEKIDWMLESAPQVAKSKAATATRRERKPAVTTSRVGTRDTVRRGAVPVPTRFQVRAQAPVRTTPGVTTKAAPLASMAKAGPGASRKVQRRDTDSESLRFEDGNMAQWEEDFLFDV